MESFTITCYCSLMFLFGGIHGDRQEFTGDASRASKPLRFLLSAFAVPRVVEKLQFLANTKAAVASLDPVVQDANRVMAACEQVCINHNIPLR